MKINNLFKNRNHIINGHLNELKETFNLINEDKKLIYSFRKKKCDSCPIKTNNVCDFNKWIHPKTKEVKYLQENGFIRGCGCRLSAKQKAYNAKCPAGFWGGEEEIIRKFQLLKSTL